MNPQQHGSLHKVKPVNIPKWVEKRLLMPHPFRATSDCPQLLTMIYLMLEEGCDFCQQQIVSEICNVWNSGDFSEVM